MSKVTKCLILLTLGLLIMPACASTGRGRSTSSSSIDNSIKKETADTVKNNNNDEDTSNEIDINIDLENSTEDSTTDKKDIKRVGKVNYGFIDIPTDWVNFKDVDVTDPILQYSDTLGKSIITLNAWHDPQGDPEMHAYESWYQIDQEGAKETKGATVILDGREVYQVYGYYDEEDIMLIMWFFKTDDDYMHYIAAEAPLANIENVFSIVEETYSLEQ